MIIANMPWNTAKTIEFDPDFSRLTERYTEEAIEFIRQHREGPFFLYLAHSMIHTPLAATAPFTKQFTDPRDAAIAELDWSTGRILDTLEELGLEEKTLVLYTSDNGRPLSQARHRARLERERERAGEGD